MNEEPLLQSLRKAAAEHKSIRELVQLIYAFYGVSSHHETIVMHSLMKAFKLRFSQVHELAGAECVGNAVHTDEEIDRILLPVIRASLEKEAN
jgi:hypothetical protein